MKRIVQNIFTVIMATIVLVVMMLAFDSTQASAEHKTLEKGQYFRAGTCILPGNGFGPNGGYDMHNFGDTFSYNGEYTSFGHFDNKDEGDEYKFYKQRVSFAYPDQIKTYYYTGGGWGPTTYSDSPGSYYDYDGYSKGYVFYMICGDSYKYGIRNTFNVEDRGLPWGVQVLDGDGTKDHPYRFGVLFSEPYSVQLYNPEHGRVSFIAPNVEAGDTVKFTVTPDSGYEIKSVARWYFDENGASIITQIKHDEEGNCSFVMPAKDIKIDATFVKKDRLASVTHGDGTRDDYDSFEEALAEWDDGSTLTMYEGARIEKPIEITENRTLDLNGYVLKSDGSLFDVKDGGSLTINDSDPEGRNLFEDVWYDGGQLLGSVDGTGYAVKGLVDVKEGVFAMNGGSLINEAESKLKWGVSGTKGAKIAINGGYVKANRAVIMDSDEDAFVFLGRARFDLEQTWPVYQKLGEDGTGSNYSVININGGYYKQDIGSLIFAGQSITPGFQAEEKGDQIDWEYDDFSFRVEDERPPYAITVRSGIEHGTVKAPAYARQGNDVKLTIKPDEHYRLKDLRVEDEEGFRLPIIDDTITMPDSALTVYAEFELMPVSDIWMSKEKMNLPEDGRGTIYAEALPYEALSRKITWTSADEKIATVDQDGNVDAVGLGRTTITATTENGFSASCSVLVYHEHKLTKVDAVEANCKKEGNTEYWRCDQGDHACGKLFSDENGDTEITESDIVVPVDGDRHGQIEGFVTTDHVLNELSCTSPLVKVVITNCNDCGAEVNITREGRAPLGHDWGEWETVKEATDTEAGQERRVCKNDSCPIHEQTRIIPAGNHEHKLTKVEAKSGTCTEPGNIEHWVCSGGDDPCGRCFADAEGKTEIEDGVETNPLGHLITAESTVKENEKPATCEEAASYESVVYCTREGCGKELSREEKTEGKALGHKWSDWKKVDNDTHQRVCEHDGSHVETASHRWDDGQVIRPTCKERGKTMFTCFDCGATKDTDITALDPDGHVYGDATYLWYSDNSRVTATHKCKYDGIIEQETAEVKMQVVKPTCTEDGAIIQKAVFSNPGFEAQIKTLPGEKAPGHTWGEWKILKKATVTADGEKEHTCSVCGETETVKIAKAGTVIKGKTAKVNVKKKAKTVKSAKAFTVTGAKGTVTYVKGKVSYKKAKSVKMTKKQLKKYKKSVSKKFVISKTTGNITVKKGLKKGVYKLSVTVGCAGDTDYEKYAKKVTVTIKI